MLFVTFAPSTSIFDGFLDLNLLFSLILFLVVERRLMMLQSDDVLVFFYFLILEGCSQTGLEQETLLGNMGMMDLLLRISFSEIVMILSSSLGYLHRTQRCLLPPSMFDSCIHQRESVVSALGLALAASCASWRRRLYDLV
ncbi:hypothetical protein L1987_07704 [Smallanthus sonchifolius]|uniref:Uncharacterized protein n=1 Tax=Smallanthus sonchifolius TaxID=185202 RepID=A0ACB9K0Y0_9ASTR|nr:hypothetical protein L1987_07704 [Smallanthus sonchifolius]